MIDRFDGDTMTDTRHFARKAHTRANRAGWPALTTLLLAFAVMLGLTARPALAQATADIPMADDVEARFITGPETLTVGDIGTLAVEVRHPAGLQVFIPQENDLWGDFEIVDRATPVTADNGDGTETTRQDLRVRLFAPGQFVTPALVVKVSDPGGNLAQSVAQPVIVNVASVLTGPEEPLRDIKPQASIPRTGFLALVLLAVVLGALLVFFLAWMLHSVLSRGTAQDTRTPTRRALDDLEQVGALNLVAEGRMKEHAGLVTDALRQYLTKQYGIAATDRTTAELRRMLRGVSMSEPLALRFGELFGDADLIKFADVHASPESATLLLAEARTLVIDSDAEVTAHRAALAQKGKANPSSPNAATAGA